MIAIVDYGAGNLRSVELAFRRLGVPMRVTGDTDVLAAASGVVLPGVGAFSDAMAALDDRGLTASLKAAAASGKPFLGICLGLQALFDGSEEGPGVPGLGIVPGFVRRLPDGVSPLDGRPLKIPHIGWNSLSPAKESPLLDGLPTEPYAYFVHSYACFAAEERDVLTVTEYGVPFHSAIQRGAVIGMQFHPEKSGRIGETLLRSFVRLVKS